MVAPLDRRKEVGHEVDAYPGQFAATFRLVWVGVDPAELLDEGPRFGRREFALGGAHRSSMARFASGWDGPLRGAVTARSQWPRRPSPGPSRLRADGGRR